MKRFFSVSIEMELEEVENGFKLTVENIKGIKIYIAENEDKLKKTIYQILDNHYNGIFSSIRDTFAKICNEFGLKINYNTILDLKNKK